MGKFADVVDFDRAGVLAQLASSRPEPADQLFAAGGDRG